MVQWGQWDVNGDRLGAGTKLSWLVIEVALFAREG